MGFLSTLAKIAGPVAAPFTGGLSAILPIAGALGGVAGKAAGGATANRNAENDAQNEANRLALTQYGVDQNVATADANLAEQGALNRSEIGIKAPQSRAKQALLGSILQNLQTAKVTAPAGINMGTITGGLTPDVINQAARAGGGELQRQALLALLSGSDVPAATDPNRPAAPTLAQPKGPGKMESILSGVGLVGSGLGALGQIGVGQKKPPTTGPWA